MSKYSQKRLDYAQQSSTYKLKTAAKRANQKPAEETGDLISNLIKSQKYTSK